MLSLAAFLWPAALLALSTPIILRGLGDAGYGVWALVGNVIGYLGLFNSLQTAGTKYLAEYLVADDRVAIRQLLGTSAVFNVVVGLVGGGAIFALARPLALHWLSVPGALQDEAVLAFRIAGAGFLVNALGWWGASALAGAQRYGSLAAIVAASSTLAAGGSVAAVELHFGVVGVAVANVVSAFLAAAAYAWSARHALGADRFRLTFDYTMLRHVLSYGAFSTLQVVFGVVTTQLDRTLLGVWIGVAAVATYSVPLAVASRIHQLAGKALEVVLPLASARGAQSGSAGMVRLFLRAQTANCLLVCVIAVPLFVLASPVLHEWIGPAFAARAGGIFQLLIIAYAVLGLNVAAANVVAGLGHPELIAGFTLVLGAVNAVGYVCLIPSHGALGAAIASAIGSVVAVPVFIWYVQHRFLQISWRRVLGESFLRPTLAALATAGLTLLARPLISGLVSLLAVLGMSSITYMALAAALGAWHPRDVPVLGGVWSRLHTRFGRISADHP